MKEVKKGPQVSAGLKQEIEASLRQRGTEMKAESVIGSARALPDTLQGPMQVHLPAGKVKRAPVSAAPARRAKRKKKDGGDS